MIVMPSNNTGFISKKLFEKYPDKIALLLNPTSLRPHHFNFRYAIDNGAYKKFEWKLFIKMLNFSKKYQQPLFIVCPDVVGCHDRTLALWKYYQPDLKRTYGYKIAFVAQNGCTEESIPKEADWIFIGGNDPWKVNNIHRFVSLGKPVHVGRVNSIGRLKYCEEMGVTSIDGTGWLRFRGKNFNELMDWFNGEQKQLDLFG